MVPTESAAQQVRRLAGYFTLFAFLRGQSLQEVEYRIGYRPGRLTAKGALLYKLLRLPDISEFDVRGTSITPEQTWVSEIVGQRAADLAAAAAYHRNTRVPSIDEIQRRNACAAMSLSGSKMAVKVYPLDWQPIDDTAVGYRSGAGISQWRLNSHSKVMGSLLFCVGPGGVIPWSV